MASQSETVSLYFTIQPWGNTVSVITQILYSKNQPAWEIYDKLIILWHVHIKNRHVEPEYHPDIIIYCCHVHLFENPSFLSRPNDCNLCNTNIYPDAVYFIQKGVFMIVKSTGIRVDV